jgi:acyl carrier protein
MRSHARAIVHHLLASVLRIDDQSIEDAHGFDQLGLDSLDLVLVVLRLEDFYRGAGEFPVTELAHAGTVSDLVTLVHAWLRRDEIPNTLRAPRSPAHASDDGRP